MRLCGKRLFTPACKAPRIGAEERGLEQSGSAVAGPPFFCGWRRALFRGVFAKSDVLVWCFCGEVVVNCVVNRGALLVVFWRLKTCHCFGIYFCLFFSREAMG
jgi:hypothetical protein